MLLEWFAARAHCCTRHCEDAFNWRHLMNYFLIMSNNTPKAFRSVSSCSLWFFFLSMQISATICLALGARKGVRNATLNKGHRNRQLLTIQCAWTVPLPRNTTFLHQNTISQMDSFKLTLIGVYVGRLSWLHRIQCSKNMTTASVFMIPGSCGIMEQPVESASDACGRSYLRCRQLQALRGPPVLFILDHLVSTPLWLLIFTRIDQQKASAVHNGIGLATHNITVH